MFEDLEVKSINMENDFSELNSTFGILDKDFSINFERYILFVDGDSLNMVNKVEMMKSQIDILKVVMVVFEEIFEFYGDESDVDEIKL